MAAAGCFDGEHFEGVATAALKRIMTCMPGVAPWGTVTLNRFEAAVAEGRLKEICMPGVAPWGTVTLTDAGSCMVTNWVCSDGVSILSLATPLIMPELVIVHGVSHR
jgi:hypothetical protein